MKKFYCFNEGFWNCYDLCYTESAAEALEAEECGYSRISRRDALSLIAEEKARRENDPAFSGFAPLEIYPFWADAGDILTHQQNPGSKHDLYRTRNHIAEYIGTTPRTKKTHSA